HDASSRRSGPARLKRELQPGCHGERCKSSTFQRLAPGSVVNARTHRGTGVSPWSAAERAPRNELENETQSLYLVAPHGDRADHRAPIVTTACVTDSSAGVDQPTDVRSRGSPYRNLVPLEPNTGRAMRTHGFVACTPRLAAIARAAAAIFVAASLVVIGPPSARAGIVDGCMQDVAGLGTLNCTAEDVTITSVHVLQVIDGCSGIGDTAQLQLSSDIEVNATTRYD